MVTLSTELYKCRLARQEADTDQFLCVHGQNCEQHALHEILLLVSVDGNVAAGRRDASQDVAFALLRVVQVGLITLVDGARLKLAHAGGARSGTARERQVESFLFGGVQDVHIVRHLQGSLLPFLVDEGDLVGSHAGDAPGDSGLHAEGFGHGHRGRAHLAARACHGHHGHNGAHCGC